MMKFFFFLEFNIFLFYELLEEARPPTVPCRTMSLLHFKRTCFAQMFAETEREYSVRLMELQQMYNSAQLELQQARKDLYQTSATKRHSESCNMLAVFDTLQSFVFLLI